MFAARAAASISSWDASGLPYRRFRRTVSWKRYVSCVTMPIASPSDARVTFRTSRPSIRTAPSSTSYRRGTRYVIVVLPAPLGPTNAASCPGKMCIETSSSVHSRTWPSVAAAGATSPSSGSASATSGGSSYRNRTWSSSTSPRTFTSSSASGASVISCFRSRYSKIRSNNANDVCTSVVTWSIEPIGKNSRACSVVNATNVPELMMSWGLGLFELCQPATR